MPEEVENTEQAEERPELVELEALRVENEELIDTLQRVKAEKNGQARYLSRRRETH